MGQIIREPIHTLIESSFILAHQRQAPSQLMTEELLDHLAEHMLFLSTVSLFWYSLNSSYDHGFHLSQRLGMCVFLASGSEVGSCEA
jgi:hypothetical protein